MKPPAKPDLAKIVPKPAATSKALKPSKPRPELPQFQPATDPIDESQYPGDPEGDCLVELGQLETGFRSRMKAEAERFKTATDGSYYFVMAFTSGEQATAFLRAVGVPEGQDLFVDGRTVADRLGIALPEANYRPNISAKIDPKLKKLVRPDRT